MSEEEQKEETTDEVVPVEEKPQEKPAAKAEKKEVVAETSEANPEPEAESKEEKEDSTSEKKEETAADLLGANIEQVKIRKAKGSKNISSGICFIVATFNNTKVSFSDMKGNVISWSSSGKCNFRGSRKSTAYAAQVVTQDAGKVAMSHGMKEVLVKVYL